jgi:hypothetical protein
MPLKPIVAAGLAALALALAACKTMPPEEQFTGVRNMWVGNSIRTASLNRAIVVQRTLYPYHFDDGSPVLNELGERDLGVLAEHFVTAPGELSVRRGSASQELYDARMRTVQDALKNAGVKMGRMQLTENLPGGDGITSERVIKILDKAPFLVDDSGNSSSTLGSQGSGVSSSGGGNQ